MVQQDSSQSIDKAIEETQLKLTDLEALRDALQRRERCEGTYTKTCQLNYSSGRAIGLDE